MKGDFLAGGGGKVGRGRVRLEGREIHYGHVSLETYDLIKTRKMSVKPLA